MDLLCDDSLCITVSSAHVEEELLQDTVFVLSGERVGLTLLKLSCMCLSAGVFVCLH